MLKLYRRRHTLADGTTSTTYQIAGTDPWTGERVRVGTRTRDPKVAQVQLDLELERRRQIALNKGIALKPKATFAELVVQYGAMGGSERYIAPMLEHWGTTVAETITPQDVSDFAAAYYPGARPSTLLRQVYGPLQWVWNAGADAELVSARRWAKPAVKSEPVRYARSDDWTLAVLRACTTVQQRCAILLLSFGGMRAAEAVSARRCD
jgi:hypothetical protein